MYPFMESYFHSNSNTDAHWSQCSEAKEAFTSSYLNGQSVYIHNSCSKTDLYILFFELTNKKSNFISQQEFISS